MKIKARTLSPMKDKSEDFESCERLRRGLWVLWNKPIGTGTKWLNLMRKQEIDSLRGSLIPNLKDWTLDLGNWYIKRKLCTYSLIWTWFLGCRCMQTSSWNASNAKGFESWKLCNAHDILSYFVILILIWFYLLFFFFLWKTHIDYLFLKDVITHDTSSYLLQISSGTPSECMFCLI